MGTEPKRAGKTEVLSMRMDPKTRFLVDLVARMRGQSISTVVERAILEVADSLPLADRRTWRDYWHVSEGVRSLNISAEQIFFPTYEEDIRLSFAKIHWPFFYQNSNCHSPRTSYVDILWPHIDDLLQLWEKTKTTDYFATGKKMQTILHDADIAAPDWPVKPPPKPPAKDPPKGGNDLDDEIPF